MQAQLIKTEQIDMRNLSALTMPVLREICQKCGIKLSNKSAVSSV